MALIISVDNQNFRVEPGVNTSDCRVFVNGQDMLVTLVNQVNNELDCIIDNKYYTLKLLSSNQIEVNGEIYHVSAVDERVKSIIKSTGFDGYKKELVIKAPMPGLVVDVLVNIGDQVEAGHGLTIIEAMKMQNEMKAPRNGQIKNIMVNKGQTVNSGDVLVIIG